MKLKLIIAIIAVGAFGTSYGQTYKTNLSSVETIDNQIQDESYSSEVPVADRLLITAPIENISKSDKQFFSRKEWRKIKKQLQKNKKRILSEANSIHSYKVVDTIYLDVPTNTKESKQSRLSGSDW